MNAGAIATIIYNNEAEDPDGLRSWLLDGVPNEPWIPSFSISQAMDKPATSTPIDRYSFSP